MLLKSYAKINLFLEILGKNAQNYHELQSLICFIDIYDQIEITKSDKLELNFSGQFGDFLQNDPSENIILRTIKLMSERFGFNPNLQINLEKNIPIGAGIGGGSSNGASIILALNQIFDLNLSKAELMEIGLKIGCDVPICLNNKMALVSGIGEKLSEINIKTKPLWALIINSGKHLSTKEVFSNLKPDNYQKSKEIPQNINFLDLIKSRENSLEKPAAKIIPEINLILNNLRQQKNCLLARMSGSGATCFGLFDNENDLENSSQILKRKFPEFYIKKTPLIYEK